MFLEGIMKQPKKLTYEHKRWLSKHNVDPSNWTLQYEDNDCYIYANKISNETRRREKIKHWFGEDHKQI